MSIFTYHCVPENQIGNGIFPLNILRKKYPELYKNALQKYVGRENLLDLKLRDFNNISFGDFSNWLLVDPQIWMQKIKELGIFEQSKTMRFYKIPIENFQVDATKIFRYDNNYTKPFQPLETIDQYQKNPIQNLPKYTLDYYDTVASKKSKFIFYHLLPHLITTRTIDVSGVKIITAK
jgi:hypothetical protein